MDKSNEKIPKQCRIGDKCFMSLATIGGNLFTRHPENLNHAHKDSNNLLSLIMILGTGVHSGETVFNDGEKINDIGKRAHVLKHFHGRCVVGAFDKTLHEGSIWNDHRDVLSFIIYVSIFLHSVYHGTSFYDIYITSYDKRNILMMMGVVFFQKQLLESDTIQNIKRLI